MKVKRMKYLVVTFLVLLVSSVSYAFSPEIDCPRKQNGEIDYKVATDKDSIESAISSAPLINNKHVVCFDQTKKAVVTSSIEVNGYDNEFILHGLRVLADIDPGEPPPSPLINVNGSNISLNNVEITNLISATAAALRISGSNVNIVNSTINASEKGIVIGSSESPASDITIEGAKIYGSADAKAPICDKDGKPENCCSMNKLENCRTKGIELINASGVTIKDNIDTIQDFDIGVDGQALVTNTTFKGVMVPIINPGPVVDVKDDTTGLYKVGKRLDESGDVVYMAGLAPVEKCSADPSDASDGLVELYSNDGTSLTWEGGCSIEKQDVGERLCLYLGMGEKPVKDDDETDEEYAVEIDQCVKDGNCYCYIGELCLFHCGDIDVYPTRDAYFVYTSGEGITYQFSTEPPEFVSAFPDVVATFAPGVPGDSPTPGAQEPESEEDQKVDGGSGVSGTGVPGDSPSNATPEGPLSEGGIGGMSMAPKVGCSLNRQVSHPYPYAIPPFIVLLALLATPVAVMVRIRNDRRK